MEWLYGSICYHRISIDNNTIVSRVPIGHKHATQKDLWKVHDIIFRFPILQTQAQFSQ